MSWFKRLLGRDEEEQAAPAAPEPQATAAPSPPVVAPVVAAQNAGGKKVKLDFKKIPKKVVEAIAAETTGQPRTIVLEGHSSDEDMVILGGDLTKAFNDAASPKPKPMKPKMMVPKP